MRTNFVLAVSIVSLTGPFAHLARAEAFDFDGSKAGDQRAVAGIKLCWCPAGRFLMGSPPGELERRPDEDQVEVTFTRGFWTSKYEATQGQWKRVVGKLPGPLTAELPEGDDYPVGNVNFAEAEDFWERARAWHSLFHGLKLHAGQTSTEPAHGGAGCRPAPRSGPLIS